jgi:hypothetical protein
MQTRQLLPQALAASLISAVAISPVHAAEGGWDWVVVPYLWGTQITTDAEVRGEPVSTETSFSDILDKLDFAFQVHAEGQGDQFGLMTDYTYLSLSDDSSRDRFSVDASLDTTIFELAAVWSPGEERYTGFEAFAGLRYLDTELDLKFDLTDPALSDQRRTLEKSFTDAMIGARYTTRFNDNWGMTLRGDGSFGDTEGGFNTSAIFQYQSHPGGGAWAFGYRYMTIELETGAGESVDLTMSGPIAGYAYKF